MLAEILKTPDEKMTRCHYQDILGPFLPAGTYEEAAYFLSRAFDHIRSHDDDGLDLVTSLVWFISEYQKRLEADGVLAACRDLMESCFDQLVASELVAFADFQTYWRDTFNALGIESVPIPALTEQ